MVKVIIGCIALLLACSPEPKRTVRISGEAGGRAATSSTGKTGKAKVVKLKGTAKAAGGARTK